MTLNKYSTEELKHELNQRAIDGRMLREQEITILDLKTQKKELEQKIEREEKQHAHLLKRMANKREEMTSSKDEFLNRVCAICKEPFEGCGLSCAECLERCVNSLLGQEPKDDIFTLSSDQPASSQRLME